LDDFDGNRVTNENFLLFDDSLVVNDTTKVVRSVKVVESAKGRESTPVVKGVNCATVLKST